MAWVVNPCIVNNCVENPDSCKIRKYPVLALTLETEQMQQTERQVRRNIQQYNSKRENIYELLVAVFWECMFVCQLVFLWLLILMSSTAKDM